MRNRSNSTCPDEILEWIPWYPDQGLTPSQRGAVEAHAAGCTACREEISVLQGSAAPTIELPDAERVFAQVLARIEDDGVEGPSRAMPASAVTRPAAPARPGRGRGGWSRPAALAAGLGLAVLCTSIGALGTAYFLGGAAARDASYTTAAAPQASAAGTPAADEGVALDVVFQSGVEVERINMALRAIGGQIVDGPSQLGRYRIRLPAGSDAWAAAKLLRADGTGVAAFAEPVAR